MRQGWWNVGGMDYAVSMRVIEKVQYRDGSTKDLVMWEDEDGEAIDAMVAVGQVMAQPLNGTGRFGIKTLAITVEF